MRFIFVSVLLSLTVGCFSVLSPFYQSVRELQVVLSDPNMAELLGNSQPIQEIRKTDSGYIVTTPNRMLEIEVRYGSQSRPGPIPFEIHFGQPVDLSERK